MAFYSENCFPGQVLCWVPQVSPGAVPGMSQLLLYVVPDTQEVPYHH